jgi:SAM-dependent methyltransferase
MATNDFEKAYYEADSFWSGNMVQDPANTKRIEITADFVAPDVASLIDVGCGNGVFLNFLRQKRKIPKLTGVERSEAALKYVSGDKINASIESIPVDSKSFDCVSCLEVLEHLPLNIYQQSLDELARVSKKYIIVSVPYKEVLEESYTRCPSCRTIFNYELHLRSYDDEIIKNLFLSRGFECIKTITTGTGVHFRGHRTFLKLFYPETLYVWRSPVCPLCGYQNIGSSAKSAVTNNSTYRPKRKLISYVSLIPKLLWPKEKKDYWVIALYRKI